MTNAIEVTKRELFNRLEGAKKATARLAGGQYGLTKLDGAIEAHLEALRQEIEGLRGDVKRAEQEVEKKDAALKIAGEELRAAQAKASGGNRLVKVEDAWRHSMKIASVIFVGDALKEAQAVVTEWLVPDGIRARDAMKKLVKILDSEGLVMAQRHLPDADDRG